MVYPMAPRGKGRNADDLNLRIEEIKRKALFLGVLRQARMREISLVAGPLYRIAIIKCIDSVISLVEHNISGTSHAKRELPVFDGKPSGVGKRVNGLIELADHRIEKLMLTVKHEIFFSGCF